MTRTRPFLLIMVGAHFAGPVAAQSSGPPGDLASAAQNAIQALPSAAKDKLLVKDLLGAKVVGPGGNPVGTVEDLVVVPGGRVVAAIISTKAKGAGRIPVPFSAVKLSRTAGTLGLTLPVEVSKLRAMKEIQSLADQLPGVN